MIDRRGYMMAIGTGAEEKRHTARGHILRGHCGQRALDLELALMRRQIDRFSKMNAIGHIAEQAIDRRRANDDKHVPPVRLGERQVPHQLWLAVKSL